MSAIFGIINKNTNTVVKESLNDMLRALNHWEADDQGVWHSGNAGLGHLMLYNTPESLFEKLPFYKSDSRLVITADARIDNREELFSKLTLPKNDRHLVTDSTLILQVYEKYGEDCVLHLIGDFAFAIWDEREQKLFCARDHTGVKPFFYYMGEHFFAFATEVKGLLAINGLNKEINEAYFLKLTAHLIPPKKETAYQYIFRLDVAHTLTVKNAAIQFKKYWELDAKKEIVYEDKQQYLEKFRELFTEAVRCRLRSNYLIGTELSGGLDSGGITAVAAKLLHAQNKKIAAFVSVYATKDAYEDENEREEFYADEMIEFAAIDIVEKKTIEPTKRDYMQGIDDVLSVYGYPCKYPSGNRYFYEKAAAMQIRTLLSGHGGDHLVTDYNWNYILDYFNNKQYKTYFKLAIKQWGIKQALLNVIKTKLKQPVPPVLHKLMLNRLIKRTKTGAFNFLSPDFFPQVEPSIRFNGFRRTFKEVQKDNISVNFIGDRVEFETLHGLKFKICPAFPMLDIRLMEFVLALPTEEKMQPGKYRLLYRRAMQGLMPEKVVTRKTKHLPPMISPAQIKWLSTRDSTKNWILDLQKKKQIPPFINTEKLMQWYAEPTDNGVFPNNWSPAIRKQIELIIRWFETRD